MAVPNQGSQKKVDREAVAPVKGDRVEVDAGLTLREIAVDDQGDAVRTERLMKTLGFARGCSRFEPMGVDKLFLTRPVLEMFIFRPKI